MVEQAHVRADRRTPLWSYVVDCIIAYRDLASPTERANATMAVAHYLAADGYRRRVRVVTYAAKRLGVTIDDLRYVLERIDTPEIRLDRERLNDWDGPPGERV